MRYAMLGLSNKFRVIFSARGIFVENGSAGDSFSGFVACRYVKADSEQHAVAVAKRDILMEWNDSYNRKRNAGVPHLKVELAGKLKNPFKSGEELSGYRFFNDDDQAEDHLLEISETSGRWF